MKIAVAGVSGHTGKVVAEELLGSGHAVRVIVRKREQGPLWEAKGASVAIADLSDAESLTAALRGMDSAYLLIPPDMANPDFRAFQKRTAESLAKAVGASGLRHVVLLSSVGAQHPDGTGPVAGLYLAEKLLGAVPNVVVTSLRPGYFDENLRGMIPSIRAGVLPSFLPASFKFPIAGTRAIGRLAALQLMSPPSRSSVIQLGTFTTFGEIAGVFAKLLGRDVRAQEIPLEAIKPAMLQAGLNDGMAGMFAEMYEAMLNGRIAFEAAHEHSTAVESLDAMLAEQLRA